MILGSGTSIGVPFIGCDCAVCTSTNPRNRRLRCSLLVRGWAGRILVDCGPDFREQALTHDLRRVDGVVLTHSHADHIFGLDDLRLYMIRARRPMPVYARPEVLDAVKRIYAYAFDGNDTGSFKPCFELRPVSDSRSFECGGIAIQPVLAEHGDTTVLGVRIGDFAYVPDVKRLPSAAMRQLEGLDVLVIDGLRKKPHRTHFNRDEALAAIAALRPRRAWLTHLTHDYDDDLDNDLLPPHTRLAYDGLTIPIRGYDAEP